MIKATATSPSALLANEVGYDPIEDRLHLNIRSTIEAVFEEELEQFLGRCRYGRRGEAKAGYRHGHRERQLIGTFGTETVSVPRAWVTGEDGTAREWRSKALPRYQWLTKKAGVLIAAVYLSGTNTRRVKRALFGLFQGAVSKDMVNRAWRKVKTDWQAWCDRSLADVVIVRLILDGTVIKNRLDERAPNISVLAAILVRRDGKKVLLSLMNMGGESTAAWRQFINDLEARRLKRPEFVIVDRAPGLEAALVGLWGEDLPIQRCTVHKHRNLLAHAPKHMHDELTEDYRDMIYAKTSEEVATRRKAFGGKTLPGMVFWPVSPAQMATEMQIRRGRSGRGRQQALRFHPPAAKPVEISPDNQCNRTSERGISPPRQNPDRAAMRRDHADAALGADGLGPDHHVQGRRLGNPQSASR